ncbi:rho family-interacting cell polarization regulator 1-like isoform X4 [Lethenteron reissneri]|uniref:rho family-interacting cell polarization regulator 1-like isoform X4 n=1 Tax=Lethenteron reissneri TaxID=7753 RepID=UPI002AB642B2|nr:rho family-interacting cell polarization regulator 1-like isoform X4 [Lethenteron reissneri]
MSLALRPAPRVGLVFRSQSFAGFSSTRDKTPWPRSPYGSTPVQARRSPTRSVKGSSASGKPPGGALRTPRPQQAEHIYVSLRRGLGQLLKAHHDELESLVAQQKGTKRDSRMAFFYELDKQLRATQRYLRHLEFHISKIEELYESYCIQGRLRDGARKMVAAYQASRNSRLARAALLAVAREHRDYTESLCMLENELEKLLGEFHIQMKGLAGFARLCPGDQYEVTELRGLASHTLVGSVACETGSLFAAGTRIVALDINSLGTIKLHLEVTWNPFDKDEAAMTPLTVGKLSANARRRALCYGQSPPATPSLHQAVLCRTELQPTLSSASCIYHRVNGQARRPRIPNYQPPMPDDSSQPSTDHVGEPDEDLRSLPHTASNKVSSTEALSGDSSSSSEEEKDIVVALRSHNRPPVHHGIWPNSRALSLISECSVDSFTDTGATDELLVKLCSIADTVTLEMTEQTVRPPGNALAEARRSQYEEISTNFIAPELEGNSVQPILWSGDIDAIAECAGKAGVARSAGDNVESERTHIEEDPLIENMGPVNMSETSQSKRWHLRTSSLTPEIPHSDLMSNVLHIHSTESTPTNSLSRTSAGNSIRPMKLNSAMGDLGLATKAVTKPSHLVESQRGGPLLGVGKHHGESCSLNVAWMNLRTALNTCRGKFSALDELEQEVTHLGRLLQAPSTPAEPESRGGSSSSLTLEQVLESFSFLNAWEQDDICMDTQPQPGCGNNKVKDTGNIDSVPLTTGNKSLDCSLAQHLCHCTNLLQQGGSLGPLHCGDGRTLTRLREQVGVLRQVSQVMCENPGGIAQLSLMYGQPDVTMDPCGMDIQKLVAELCSKLDSNIHQVLRPDARDCTQAERGGEARWNQMDLTELRTVL